MRKFIKSSYLFLIFFILLLSKDYLLNFFHLPEDISYETSYIKSLESEIENMKLLNNIPYKEKGSYGKVLYQNPYREKEIVIYTNNSDIEIGSIVINNDGVLGKVSSVYKSKVILKLLNHPESKLQVQVESCYGILNGGENLYISGINKYCDVKEGSKVYISNLEKAGENILVGSISKIEEDINKISDKYIVRPAADFNNLRYVLIIGGA